MSERALMDCKQFWRSTILFDVFSHLNSINAIINHASTVFTEGKDKQNRELMKYAKGLTEQIITTLKSTVEIDELADGTLLTNQNNTKPLSKLLKDSAARYEPMATHQKAKLSLKVEGEIPLVSFDVERLEQVVNSIFEIIMWQEWGSKEIGILVQRSSKGLHGQEANYVHCAFSFPSVSILPAKTKDILNAPDTEWKNLRDIVSVGAFNLAISKRIVEAHAGDFRIAEQDNMTVVEFTLPII